MLAGGVARADSIANFWLSNVDAGPTVPVIYAFPGATSEIKVWARPAVGYRMAAFSLDLVAETPGVISFQSIDVVNPLIQAMPPLYRHQLTFDSASGLDMAPEVIDSFLGYSFFENAEGLPDGAGIGPVCGIDSQCCTGSGSPSWHIATVAFQAGISSGASELFLQIGEQGIWQSPADAAEPDPPFDTSAVFGLANDAINEWSVLGGTDHRHNHQGLADAIVRVATADFDQDGDVDGADFLAWQRGLGGGTTLAEGDADGDGSVNAIDLAAWRFQFGSSAAAVALGSSIPEPRGVTACLVFAVILSAVGRRR
jgi:hypothetical protein